MVASIHEDAAGTIWLGTWEGLFRLAAGKTTGYGPAQGLPNNQVTAVLEDAQGYLWLGTARGVQRVQRKQLDDVAEGRAPRVQAEEFGAADGMRVPDVNAAAQPSACVDQRGRLWFATPAGAVMIDPARTQRNPLAPHVVVEDAVADGASLGGSAVRLLPGTSRLEIRYTALSLLVPEKVRFRFKLEGFDDIGSPAARAAWRPTRTCLPGSLPVPRVAANNDGLWNETGAALDIRQLPHFYQTTLVPGSASLGHGRLDLGVSTLSVPASTCAWSASSKRGFARPWPHQGPERPAADLRLVQEDPRRQRVLEPDRDLHQRAHPRPTSATASARTAARAWTPPRDTRGRHR